MLKIESETQAESETETEVVIEKETKQKAESRSKLYYDENGNLLKNTYYEADGVYLYLGPDGYPQPRIYKKDGKTYYLGEDGQKRCNYVDVGYAVIPIEKVDLSKDTPIKFYGEDGGMYQRKTAVINGVEFYAEGDGTLSRKDTESPITETIAETAEDISAKSPGAHWEELNGRWIYRNSDGSLIKDIAYIDGECYCFNGDGYMMTNWIVLKDEGQGRPASSFHGEGMPWKYWGHDGKLLRNGSATVNGYIFTADASGQIISCVPE